MAMTRGALVFNLLVCLASLPEITFAQVAMTPSAGSGAVEQNTAYQNYLKRPKCEFSKLLYLVDRIQTAGEYKVIYKDREYRADKMTPIVRLYVAHSYKNEKAEKWIHIHAYRTADGRLIYVKEPSGKLRILKDLLLEELNALTA